MKIPFVQSVVLFDVRTQRFDSDASAASKDLQTVSAKIAVNYHVTPETVPELYTKIGVGYRESVITPAEQEVVKATTAHFTAEELITKRGEVSQTILDGLRERLQTRGIIVENINIVDFDFSPSFNEAIESKVTAEQLKLKAEKDLERIRIEALQTEAVAIGQKKAQIAQAQAQAESIRVIEEELRKSPTYIEYLRVQRWNGIMPLVVGTSGTLIDIPITSVGGKV